MLQVVDESPQMVTVEESPEKAELSRNASVQSQRVLRHCLLITAVCLLTFFAGLGRSAIGDSDEAFYAESAREMIESGDWLTPHYNYEYRFQKPILFYWLVAATYSVAGMSEAAARFPSALAGLGLALLTYFAGRRWFGNRTGLIAGIIVATNFGYFTIARSALPDLPLAFFIALATWTLIEGVIEYDADTPERRREQRVWLLLAAAAMALGVLTKGPVGVALPIMVLIPLALIRRRPWKPSSAGWFGVPWSTFLWAAAAFLAIATPWFAAMTIHHGDAYLHRFFVGENLERFATDRYNEPRSYGFYVPIVLGGLAPWTPFVFLWVRGAIDVLKRQRKLSMREWQTILWAAVPLIFYTLSIGKQPRYILPVLPALALLAARSLVHRMEHLPARAPRHRSLAICGTASAVVLLVLAFLLHRARPLLFALSPVSGQIGVLVIVVAGIALALVSWFARHHWLPTALAASSCATLLALHYCVYSGAGLEPVQRIARLFAAERQHNEPSATHHVFVRNMVFYTGVKQSDLFDQEEATKFLNRPERVLVVMPEDALVLLERAGVSVKRLASVLYFNPSGVRLRTLLSPEPAHDLETVWLVSNR